MIQRMLEIWSLFPLPFLNPAWTSGSSQLTYCWSPGLENFEHYFTSLWDECHCAVVWTFFGITFLWNGDENWSFPVLWSLLCFLNLLAYWVQHSPLARPLTWHHWLNGHGFGWTLGVGDGQGGLACCSSQGCKESDTTERLNWTNLDWPFPFNLDQQFSFVPWF